MATGALTGRDAVEAIGLAAHLGERGSRFDGRRLMEALRTRSGRLRIRVGETLGLRASAFHVETRSRRPAERRHGRPQRRSRANAVPDRPSDPPRGEVV
jgi:hypothetical protein